MVMPIATRIAFAPQASSSESDESNVVGWQCAWRSCASVGFITRHMWHATIIICPTKDLKVRLFFFFSSFSSSVVDNIHLVAIDDGNPSSIPIFIGPERMVTNGMLKCLESCLWEHTSEPMGKETVKSSGPRIQDRLGSLPQKSILHFASFLNGLG